MIKKKIWALLHLTTTKMKLQGRENISVMYAGKQENG